MLNTEIAVGALATGMAAAAAADVTFTPLIVSGDLTDRQDRFLVEAGVPNSIDRGPLLAPARVTEPGGGEESGLLEINGRHTSTIYLTYDQLPGFPAGVHFYASAHPRQYLRSDGGDGVIVHRLDGPLIDSHNDESIWRVGSQGLELVVQEDAAAPGLPPHVKFDVPADASHRVDVSAGGDIVFDAILAGPGIDATNRWSLWLAEPDAEPQLLVWQGSDGSGGVPQGTNRTINALGRDGTILLAGSLNFLPGSNGDMHVWRGRPGAFERWFGVGDTVVDSIGPTELRGVDLKHRAPGWIGDELLFLGEVRDDQRAGSLMLAHEGGVDVLVRWDSEAPGFPGDTLRPVAPLAMTPEGDIYFQATIWNFNAGARDSYWRRSPGGQLSPIVWEGQIVDDRRFPEAIQSLEQLLVDERGHVLLHVRAKRFDLIEREALLGWDPQFGLETLLMREDPFEPGGGGMTFSFWLTGASGSVLANLPEPAPVPAALIRFDRNGELRSGIFQIRWPACPADLTGSTDPNHSTYGLPDGEVSVVDFFYFIDGYAAGDADIADLTGSTDPNDPGYGVPDGIIDVLDFFYFLDQFVMGCP